MSIKHPKGQKRPKSGSDARHFRMYHAITAMPVWKTMEPIAKALFLEVLERNNGINNGTIGYSVREAEEAGVMDADTAVKAFRILQERGFLRVGRDSHFTTKVLANGHGINRTGTRAREWRITFLPGPNDEKPTLDFLRWEPANPPLEKQSAVRRCRTQRPKVSDAKPREVN
jgi:hypothetical protein